MQAATDTLGLAALPPGPRLAAALGAVELSGVPNDRILEVLAARHRQLCHEQARMAAVLAEVGRCRGYPAPGEVTRLAAPERYASEETRAALRWTRRSAEWEHSLAETVVHSMPGLHAAWLAGVVDRPRVTVFDRFLTGLAAAQVAEICRVAVPRAPRLTTGQLAVLLRRMVLAVDPEAAARWYRKGVRERDVIAVMGHDGTVTMSANGLPADEAEASCVRVQDLAAAAKHAGHPGLIGQIRCDLFLGMLDGRFHAMSTEQIIAMAIAQYRADGPGSAVARHGGERIGGRRGPSGRGRSAHGPGGGTHSPGGEAPGSVGAAQPGRGAQGEGPARHGPDAATGYRGEQVGIEVRVALSTLLGRDSQPGEIPGLGLLPAADTLARVALQRRAQWRFAVTDAAGRLLSEGVTRRRPDTVGAHAVRRDGPPGGIVEIHVPAALLHELVACGPPASGAWAAVVADIADRHARRDAHLADLDRRRATGSPAAPCAATPRSATAPAPSPAVAAAPTPPSRTTPATMPRAGPRSAPTSARCAVTTTTSSTAADGI